MNPRKQLVVNADDFGFTPDVNEGIVDANRRGILTATTLMANGEAFEHGVKLALQTPSLDVGVHLVLVSGRSLVTGKPLPSTVGQLLSALAKRQIQVYDELAAQVKHVLKAGIQPSHLDTHKHTHLAPPVLDAVARIGQEYGIRWVRRPFDFPIDAARGAAPLLKRMTSNALRLLRRRFHHVLTTYGCRTTDHFAGFQITGRFRAAELVRLLDALPDGTTEFMCHPGRCGDALRHAPTRLKESRERELEALLAPEVQDAVRRNGIQLVRYPELG